MQPTLACQLVPALPKLSWIAEVDLPTGAARALHGPGVETGPGWLVEGVWDSDFRSGGFHQSECFFGSGIRVAGDGLYFVSSVSLTDRVVYARQGDLLHVSNSLALLLAHTGATLDPAHSYLPESWYLAAGLSKRDRRIRLRHPGVSEAGQFCHERLVVRDGACGFEVQTDVREFGSFAEYHGALRSALSGIAANARDPGRKQGLDGYTTASAGYDSSCVSTLVRELGVRECFTQRRSNTSLPRWLDRQANTDDGSPIASRLGYTVRELNPGREARREVVFRAVSRIEPELAFDTLMDHVEQTGRPAVLYTGFYGDGMWGMEGRKDDAHELSWRLMSGLSLGEIRLHAGVVHVPVPFLFARSGRSVAAISGSDEMRPWRVGTAYDRPIPRRILEEAGIPRDAFGTRKRAILDLDTGPLSPGARRDFLAWVRANSSVSPRRVALYAPVNRAAFLLRGTFDVIRDRVRGTQTHTPRESIWTEVDPHGLMFHWAVDTLARDYGRRLAAGPGPAGLPGEALAAV